MQTYPRRTPAVLLAVVGLTLTACGSDRGDDLPPPPASAPASSQDPIETIALTPKEEQAVEEAQAKFDEFMNAYVHEATTGEPYDSGAGPVIGGHPLKYLTIPLYQEIQAEFVEYYNAGQLAEGDLRWTFLGVKDVDLDRMVGDENVPAVWLQYCIDPSDWQMVDAETRQTAEGSTGLPDVPEVAVFRAVWYDDDDGARTEGWRVAEREWTGESC
jgi:hypothetical protein